MKSFFVNLLKIIFFLLLPFIALIRGAVFLHTHVAMYAWFSILGGVIVSALVIFLYMIYLEGHFRGRLGDSGSMKIKYWLAFSVVLVYCIPGLLFLSAANAKGGEAKEEFSSLHPILRLSISTLIFLEKDLIITDAKRYPEDYPKMGLPTKNHSLHYRQADGFAHAVDIRTKGHGLLRNTLVKWYFNLMGFTTLRHVGTDDHLHVSLGMAHK